MTESSDRPEILVGIDGSPGAQAAIRWAAGEAALRDASITLVHVIAPIVPTWPIETIEAEYAQWQQENAQHLIKQARATIDEVVEGASVPMVRDEIRYDGVVPGLAAVSRTASMLVLGSRGLGLVGGAVLGSVSRGVLHRADCPVVIVKGNAVAAPDQTSPVLLGIDGSPASEAATAFAFDEASRRGVELVALLAWSDVGVFPMFGMDWHKYEQQGHELLAERLAGWQERYPDVNVRRRIVCDRPAHWLIEAAVQAQLAVVGSRGRGGFPGMRLGSVSTAVAESAVVPVIVIPEPS
ncbi:universal stress protein [Mycobacterium sp. Y57]|uniref:universal stress protein n=1 Tax=Mycolicibacterium xanthum TaxID=2796469 RepID=UPI001C85B397|nr:universal stress protein [Mycolicibacterium xanthum]MBX7433670.1 universal stress protein [Mycolicibacterium xanthum]